MPCFDPDDELVPSPATGESDELPPPPLVDDPPPEDVLLPVPVTVLLHAPIDSASKGRTAARRMEEM